MLSTTSCVGVQVDTDGDRLVSLSEFMAATQRDEFLEKDEWHVRLEVRLMFDVCLLSV